ncbi:hypothetical protein AUP43_13750 [Oceanibaculum pacificum]|uniref:Uncharacterized protein n=2 Tax=Oceanibaculum pacificum TaxID=580166 RepID=A0A154VJF6_9PROT|nr:hypothetical protein AUP43_13750 [Oceanibaculum pacificum]
MVAGTFLSAGLAWAAMGWLPWSKDLPTCNSSVSRNELEEMLQSEQQGGKFVITRYRENRRAVIDDQVRERDCMARVVVNGAVHVVHYHIVVSENSDGYHIGIETTGL